MSIRIGLPMKLAQIVDYFDQEKYMRITRRILTSAGVTVEGQPLWIGPDIFWDCAFPGAITVGDRCVISRRVVLLTHDFSLDRVAEAKFGRSEQELTHRGPISIGELSFIGLGVIVLPGVSIGRSSIVGSGSVVTKDVPEGVVVAGNPAKVLGTIDDYWERRQDKFIWQGRR